jgi:hypothetical protein
MKETLFGILDDFKEKAKAHYDDCLEKSKIIYYLS